jgi:uncharacterized peroxidase-related enzyme
MALDAPAPLQGAPSWLNLPDPAPLTPEVKAIFSATRDKLGYVRNQQRVLAHKPAYLAAVTALGDAIVRDPDGVLSPCERELMALVVSVENRCEACVFAHAAALRERSGDPAWVATIEVNFRRAELSPRERALADYALKATRAAAEIEPADLQALRDAGVPEEGVLEAAAIVAYFNFTNRLNSALGIRANAEAYRGHR